MAVLTKSKKRGVCSRIAISEATDRLLRAIKKKIVHEKRKMDYDKLAGEGYSKEIISRLKEIKV